MRVLSNDEIVLVSGGDRKVTYYDPEIGGTVTETYADSGEFLSMSVDYGGGGFDWGSFDIHVEGFQIDAFGLSVGVDVFTWDSSIISQFADMVGGAASFWAGAGYNGHWVNTGELLGTHTNHSPYHTYYPDGDAFNEIQPTLVPEN